MKHHVRYYQFLFFFFLCTYARDARNITKYIKYRKNYSIKKIFHRASIFSLVLSKIWICVKTRCLTVVFLNDKKGKRYGWFYINLHSVSVYLPISTSRIGIAGSVHSGLNCLNISLFEQRMQPFRSNLSVNSHLHRIANVSQTETRNAQLLIAA